MTTTDIEAADAMGDIVLLCRGKRENGNPFWAYLSIKPSKARAFKEAQARGSFYLEDFGKLLEWGEGEEVPADMKAELEAKYKQEYKQQQELAQIAGNAD